MRTKNSSYLYPHKEVEFEPLHKISQFKPFSKLSQTQTHIIKVSPDIFFTPCCIRQREIEVSELRLIRAFVIARMTGRGRNGSFIFVYIINNLIFHISRQTTIKMAVVTRYWIYYICGNYLLFPISPDTGFINLILTGMAAVTR